MLTADIMTREVTTARPDEPLADAVEKMVRRRLSGLPVVDETGAVAGILTEGDLLRRIELSTAPQYSWWMRFLRGPAASAGDYVESRGRRVADVMTREAVTVAPETPLDEVVSLMQRRRIKRLPVVQDEKLVGLLSRADLVRALYAVLRAPQAAAADDAAIAEQLLAELRGQTWFIPDQCRVSVTRGVVTLSGIYTDPAAHEAMLVAARNVAGAREVVDQLDYVSPVAGPGV